MLVCSLCGCLACSQSTSESLAFSESTSESPSFQERKTISKKEDAEPVVSTTPRVESRRSWSSDLISETDCHQITVECEELSSQESVVKPQVIKYHSLDTLIATKHGKPELAFLKGPRMSNLKPLGGRPVFLPDKKEWSFMGENNRDTNATNVISDWGDCYEDEDIRISNASFQRVYEDNWSEWSSSQNSQFPRFGSTLLVKPMAPVEEMPVSPGMVWAMLRTKTGQKFQLLNLSSSLQEVVDTFLRVETGKSLPVSFTLSTNTPPKLLPPREMDMALSENLKGYLDEETQGLSFFVGPVNTKLCYKMYVSDLEQLQRFFTIQRVC